MAYPHTEYEVWMLTSRAEAAGGVGGPQGLAANATGAGSRGTARWRPGYVPHIVRNVAVVQLSTVAFVTKPVISIRTGAANATQTSTGNQITSLTLTSIVGAKASATGARTVWYKSALLNSIVNPGSEVVAVVTTKATLAGPVGIVLYVEPKWETPANISNMKTA